MAFHDSTVVIIETSKDVVRAGIGLHELLKTPSVEIKARVGLRPSASNGDANSANSTRASSAPSDSRGVSVAPPTAGPSDYIVGAQLDEALAAGQNVAVFWPFREDTPQWAQAEALWKHILFNQLNLRRAQNESPVFLSIPAGFARSAYQQICQIFFERLNVAGFAVLERPIAQLYAANSMSGLVVDVGQTLTVITPICDGLIIHSACSETQVGTQHCEAYLAHLLSANQSVTSTLSPAEAPLGEEQLQRTLLDLSHYIWTNGHVKVPSSGETAVIEDEGVTDIAAIVVAGKEKAVIESGMKKRANAKASAAEQARAREIEALDLITVEFNGKSLTIGKERHRFCEPLFDPSLLAVISDSAASTWPVQDAAGHAVGLVPIEQRQYVWKGLLFTGDLTRHVRGIGIAMQSRLAPFLSAPELQTELQPKIIRVLGIPEYYPEYRETGDGYAAFLGSSITAKVVFNDNATRSYVSKNEYTNKGPRAIIEYAPVLL